ncbi:pigment-dispersing hormone type 1-like [Argiope bruennichi]|uniref:Uncharacterized protein n=1 Tax=Argiope bruennichi TaxID=94029 RepID=A0A8T0G2V6_ARGBR|nr:pigment-dispersing hormone type 1-like [Argiope bruennichi]KAF8796380.1 hypothetical protein HNY73_000761 [Argiope bruennichi]
MISTKVCSAWMKVVLTVGIICVLLAMVGCCENATESATPLGVFTHHSMLNGCITDIVRAICNALKPSPIKRNTELINSILGLPRVLQEAGR